MAEQRNLIQTIENYCYFVPATSSASTSIANTLHLSCALHAFNIVYVYCSVSVSYAKDDLKSINLVTVV
jgi:hypothetical protein